MGFLGRLFGTDPAAKLEKGRKLIARGEYHEAIWALEGLEDHEAQLLLAEARDHMARLNLEEAEAHFSAGEVEVAKSHLALAEEFGASKDALRAARRRHREHRATHEKATQEATAKKSMELEGDDPLWSLSPDDPRVRYAIVLETWPEALRARLIALGPEMATAVAALEAGEAASAFEAMSPLVHIDPVARYDRARAAIELGRTAVAASDLATFADEPGHTRVGTMHTAVLHAQVLARLGRLEEALQVVDRVILTDPDLGVQAVRASVLEGLGRTEEVAEAASQLLMKAPTDQGLVKLLARARVRLGDRLGAMQALEAGTAKTCCTPGKCGTQLLDPDLGRMLARLYLEDRMDLKRAKELLGQVRSVAGEPVWEDGYLAALLARNEGDPSALDLAGRLRAQLPAGDPREQLLSGAFPA